MQKNIHIYIYITKVDNLSRTTWKLPFQWLLQIHTHTHTYTFMRNFLNIVWISKLFQLSFIICFYRISFSGWKYFQPNENVQGVLSSLIYIKNKHTKNKEKIRFFFRINEWIYKKKPQKNFQWSWSIFILT